MKYHLSLFVNNSFIQAKSVRVTNDFVGTLKSIVGDTNVSTADAVREQHGHDESHHE